MVHATEIDSSKTRSIRALEASNFFLADVQTGLVPLLELLGGSGMLIGLKWQPAVWISSTGLAVLMLIAFGIRMRMRDSVAVSLPSLVLMLLNLYILIKSSER
jgi:hypothetical protein